MGWFSIFPCFTSSNHPNVVNKSLNPTIFFSSANQVPNEESTNAGSLQTPVRKSRNNCEDVEILSVKSKEDKKKNVKEGSGKLGVLVELENARERDDEKEKEKGKLGVLVQIEIENEKKGVHVETENDNKIDIQSTSSYISYPPMHRYHNCVTHEDEEQLLMQEDSFDSLFSLSIDRRGQSMSCPVEVDDDDKEVNSLMKTTSSPELIAKSNKSIDLDHLQENENLNLTSKASDQKGQLKKDTVLTTSFSNWMVDPEKSTTLSKVESQYSVVSDEATSWRNFEDRPILGALTSDEVKLVSAWSTPRKSTYRNPDDTPIIGTVGRYWSHTGQVSNSCTSPLAMSAKSRRRKESKALRCDSASSKRRLERAFEKSVN